MIGGQYFKACGVYEHNLDINFSENQQAHPLNWLFLVFFFSVSASTFPDHNMNVIQKYIENFYIIERT